MKRIRFHVTMNMPLVTSVSEDELHRNPDDYVRMGDVYKMELAGDTREIARPGQFVNLALDGKFLRRPISVCDWDGAVPQAADGDFLVEADDGFLTLVYKVVGHGTEQMVRLDPGDAVDALVGLGNGYDVDACPDRTLLVGGGAGIPPLYALAKQLIAAGKHPTAVLGFNREDEIFYSQEFAALDIPVILTTVDGSVGVKGFVTDAMPERAYVCCCGPEPMLKAVYNKCADGQFSFEARMGCGFGACMGCSMQTANGPKRIC